MHQRISKFNEVFKQTAVHLSSNIADTSIKLSTLSQVSDEICNCLQWHRKALRSDEP